MRMNQHALPRERSLDRLSMGNRHPRARERSLDRSFYLRDDPTSREPMGDELYRESGHRTAMDRFNMTGRHGRRERSLDRAYLRDDPGMYRDREALVDDLYRDQTAHRGNFISFIWLYVAFPG